MQEHRSFTQQPGTGIYIMKKTLKLFGISFLGGIVIAGIAAFVQAVIIKAEVDSYTKFISNCTFFSTLAYVLCMMYVVLEKNDVIRTVRYIKTARKAEKEGAEPPYKTLEEYKEANPRKDFPDYIIWLPMLVFLILTVVWM